MDCRSCRGALSAGFDGEVEPVPAAEADAHLAQCPARTRWQASAQALTRSTRVGPVGPGPDLVDAVPAAAPPRPGAVNAHRAAGLLPTFGGFVAVLQASSVSDLLDGTATAVRNPHKGPLDRDTEEDRRICAQALARLLVLDEPTNHLDIRFQLELLNLVRTLGVTTLTVMHDLMLTVGHCDRVYVLHLGRVVADGPPAKALTPELVAEVFGARSHRCTR